MYYSVKTSALISLVSAGAFALGNTTLASAHMGRLAQQSSANSLSGLHVGYSAPNQPARLTARRESWSTSTDSASSIRLASHRETTLERDKAEGRLGSDDYDVSTDQPDTRSGVTDRDESDGAINNSGTGGAMKNSQKDPGHTGPRADFHAGPHGSTKNAGPDDASRKPGTDAGKTRPEDNPGHTGPAADYHAGPHENQ